MEGFLFMEYFIAHGGIILNALFITLVLGMKPRKGSWWKIALWSHIPLGIVGFLNWLLDANYMYLCEKPMVIILSLLANGPGIFSFWKVSVCSIFYYLSSVRYKYRRPETKSIALQDCGYGNISSRDITLPY
jgi:uncharacterized membrane protein YwaF